MALKDQIAAWTAGQKMFAVSGVFLLILAILVAIYFVFFRVSYDVLFSDLRPADAAAIVQELDQREVPYRLAGGETSILVPKDKLGETRVAIAGSDLPIKGVVGFELFNESDIGLTEFAQKINYQRALQGELVRTITAMEEIESARVHLTIPERAIFRGEQSASKAAVTLHPRPGRTLDRSSVDGIQTLVASAVNDLKLSNVSILDAGGRVISETLQTEEYMPPELAEKQALEQYYKARIVQALQNSAPGQKITVEVRATSASQGNFPKLQDGEADLNTSQQLDSERNFRLFVRLITSTPLNETDQESLQSAVEQAIAFNQSLGDRVIFSNVVPSWNADTQPMAKVSDIDRSETQESGNSETEKQGLMVGNFGWLLALAVVLLLSIFVSWLFRKKNLLSQEERKNFATLLQSKLAGEGQA